MTYSTKIQQSAPLLFRRVLVWGKPASEFNTSYKINEVIMHSFSWKLLCIVNALQKKYNSYSYKVTYLNNIYILNVYTSWEYLLCYL